YITVHDAIPKRKRLIGQFHLFIKSVSVSWRVYAFTGRQDEWLSTTLYPKESGLSVSFTSS
ncbi:hypothetical protein, partial [Salmonella enterica]|uniref:hypothetical protein n=1 Tax=Salmonella enterica TaxID=28901 RepID=UPI001CB78450